MRSVDLQSPNVTDERSSGRGVTRLLIAVRLRIECGRGRAHFAFTREPKQPEMTRNIARAEKATLIRPFRHSPW
jgi:hypothetical protein